MKSFSAINMRRGRATSCVIFVLYGISIAPTLRDSFTSYFYYIVRLDSTSVRNLDYNMRSRFDNDIISTFIDRTRSFLNKVKVKHPKGICIVYLYTYSDGIAKVVRMSRIFTPSKNYNYTGDDVSEVLDMPYFFFIFFF